MKRFFALNMERTRVPNAGECPDCLTRLDAASGHGGRPPEPGDFSCCAFCGCLLRYSEDMALRRMSEDELDELDPENQKQLMHYHKMFRAAANALSATPNPRIKADNENMIRVDMPGFKGVAIKMKP